MDEMNLEQWINIKFCLKIGKSSSEMLAELKVTYREHAIKKMFLSGAGSSKKGNKMCTATQEVGSLKHKEYMLMCIWNC